MKVILDLDKISYGTLSMIGEDYGIKGYCSNAKEIEEYGDKVVEVLNKDTEDFRERLYTTVLTMLNGIKIDISKYL